jgi:hypothetical protein
MDITNWIGDWMYDSLKLEHLTTKRAIQDIYMMMDSPDYSDEDVDEALDIAAEHLPESKLVLFTISLGERHANKVSKV